MENNISGPGHLLVPAPDKVASPTSCYLKAQPKKEKNIVVM